MLPHVRTSLSSEWVVRNPAPAVNLIIALKPWFPDWLMENVRDQLLLPRLAVEVDLWDPRRDPVPIHLWLHPWLAFVDRGLAALYPPIRFKLAACLQAWHPSDPSALAMIKPWCGVWPQVVCHVISGVGKRHSSSKG